MAALDDALLTYIRARLDATVGYQEPVRPLRGGFVTDVYTFALAGAPQDWSGPLVLRVYPEDTDPMSVRRERCAQDVVAAQGLPAARVLAVEDVGGVLDRPFMVMEALRGRPQMVIELPGLLAYIPRLATLPRRHAAAMHAVHTLDAKPLIEAFHAAGIDRRSAGLEHWLDGAEATIARYGLHGLRPGLGWLRANRPGDPEPVSICHGDFFGANILERRGRVTGIVDWNLVTVADPAFDVGGQIAAYEMSAMPGPRVIQYVSLGFGGLLARGLRRAYARYRPIPKETIAYYSALRAFTELTFKLGLQAEVRLTGIERRMPTWIPEQCARYFFRRTGIRLTL